MTFTPTQAIPILPREPLNHDAALKTIQLQETLASAPVRANQRQLLQQQIKEELAQEGLRSLEAKYREQQLKDQLEVAPEMQALRKAQIQQSLKTGLPLQEKQAGLASAKIDAEKEDLFFQQEASRKARAALPPGASALDVQMLDKYMELGNPAPLDGEGMVDLNKVRSGLEEDRLIKQRIALRQHALSGAQKLTIRKPGADGLIHEYAEIRTPEGDLVSEIDLGVDWTASDKAKGLANPAQNLTEAQSNALTHGDIMKQNEDILGKMEETGYNPAELSFTNVKDFYAPNFLKTDVAKQYQSAKWRWIASMLRKESGAAISASEYKKADQQYFPQLGDDQKTINQKRYMRITKQEDVAKAAGPASALVGVSSMEEFNPGPVVEDEGAAPASNKPAIAYPYVYPQGAKYFVIDGPGKAPREVSDEEAAQIYSQRKKLKETAGKLKGPTLGTLPILPAQ